MNKFIITTDTTADLPADYVAEHNLGMLSLTYTIDGKTSSHCLFQRTQWQLLQYKNCCK